MDIGTAAAVLGVSSSANLEEIDAAYTRELDRRRAAGDPVGRLDEARDVLWARLPQTPASVSEGETPKPLPAHRPIAAAIGVLLTTPALLLAGAIGAEIGQIVLALALLSLMTAVIYHRAWRRAFAPAVPIGGWALGAAAAITAVSLLEVDKEPLLVAALSGLVAVSSAIGAFIRRHPRSAA